METLGISIDEIIYAKRDGGGYPKCAHVRTRRREVKRLVITCILVLNGRPLTVPLKEILGSSILKLFNVVAIFATKFFPVNIEQCPLLGFFLCFGRFNYAFLIWEISV